MGFGEVLVAITGIGATAATVIVYLVMRADVLKRQVFRADPDLRQAVEELRADIAALRQHESQAILTFDSTLQTLDNRLKHLERRALGEGSTAPASPAIGARSAEEPARVPLQR